MKDYVWRLNPQHLDRYAQGNCADPDQTAPYGAVWSGFALLAY